MATAYLALNLTGITPNAPFASQRTTKSPTFSTNIITLPPKICNYRPKNTPKKSTAPKSNTPKIQFPLPPLTKHTSNVSKEL